MDEPPVLDDSSARSPLSQLSALVSQILSLNSDPLATDPPPRLGPVHPTGAGPSAPKAGKHFGSWPWDTLCLTEQGQERRGFCAC
jgi:hypothetical protein